MLGAVVAILAIIAAADYLFQYRQWFERQKMSLQEIKDEFKQTEGDPTSRAASGRCAQSRMRKRMMAAVPKASVVITNPTHYAVALQYERGMNAPLCVAKGVDALALKIREVAAEHNVPIVENPPLARALHATVEIDRGDPARALQGGGRGDRLRHAAAAGDFPLMLSRACRRRDPCAAAPAGALREDAASRRAEGRIEPVMATQDVQAELPSATAGRPQREPPAPAASGWCCSWRSRWSAPPPGLPVRRPRSCRTYILALLAVLGHRSACSRCSRLPPAFCASPAASRGNPLIKTVVDGASDGVLVTDQNGRVLYANAAYLDLTDAADADDVRPVERVFIGDPDVSESVYRLLKAAREGRRLQEEVRIAGAERRAGALASLARAPARRRQARSQAGRCGSIADVTRERERQENIFQELQHAIDYLDHAPAGFFSVDAERRRSSISMRRWRPGSTTIWRRSVPAG